jgi:hypothetical protein
MRPWQVLQKSITMDHIVYLNSTAELHQLLSGEKTMLARASMGRKRPYGLVNEGDTLFFASNGYRQKAKAMAEVKSALSAEMEKKLALDIRSHYGKILAPEPQGTLLNKRYVTLVELAKARPIVPFSLSEDAHGGPGDWLVLDNIDEAIS